MLSKDEIRKKAEALLGEIWQAARSGAGRMGNDAEAALADLVLGQIEERDREVAGLKQAEETEKQRNRAIQLLHMLDRPEARHPDVAEFLDGIEKE